MKQVMFYEESEDPPQNREKAPKNKKFSIFFEIWGINASEKTLYGTARLY